jgi:hypothetical protein
VTVSGKITQGGEPVADADVTFQSQRTEIPAASRTRIGKTDAQGAFSIGDVYPGDYEVWVVKTQLNPEMAPAVPVEATDPLAKFGPGSSPLKATVGDKTEFSFELGDY